MLTNCCEQFLNFTGLIHSSIVSQSEGCFPLEHFRDLACFCLVGLPPTGTRIITLQASGGKRVPKTHLFLKYSSSEVTHHFCSSLVGIHYDMAVAGGWRWVGESWVGSHLPVIMQCYGKRNCEFLVGS